MDKQELINGLKLWKQLEKLGYYIEDLEETEYPDEFKIILKTAQEQKA